jgi:MFS family permease
MSNPSLAAPDPAADSGAWLNRPVWGMAITSFLSDLGHEAMSTLLPGFMAALGLSPAALGVVEGAADAAASFMKLAAGWCSDRIGRRKALVVGGYLATGASSGFLALASGWPLILAAKVFGWVGRGGKGPLRDAMLTDSIPAQTRGRAFGFHRAGDTLGAILGPLAAVAGMAWGLRRGFTPLALGRGLIAATLVPGVLAALAFALLVPERAGHPGHRRTFLGALAGTPPPLRRLLAGVGCFGAGDFAHTLLILAATQLLAPRLGLGRAATLGALLYVLHNLVYAVSAYPVGLWADRSGRHRRLLGLGYALGALVPLLLIPCFARGGAGLPALAAVFALAGLASGFKDTLEGAAAAHLIPRESRGLGFGLLGGVNGLGDLASSAAVGLLWAVHPAWGFGYAATLMGLGAGVMLTG